MNLKQFNQIKHDYNRIPLVREVFADLDTPLSTYLKLANEPYSYLFESVQGGEKWGRYSIIGLACDKRLKVFGHRVILEVGGEIVSQEETEDPLQYIEDYLNFFKVAEAECLPKFHGGLVGYFGYDTIRYIEAKLAKCPNPDKHQTPDILLMLSDELVVFDNLASRMFIVVHADPAENNAWEAGQARLAQLEQKLYETQLERQPQASSQDVKEDDFTSEFTREGFKAAVEKARQYIIDGDAMQIVLSQRLSIPFKQNRSTCIAHCEVLILPRICIILIWMIIMSSDLHLKFWYDWKTARLRCARLPVPAREARTEPVIWL